MLWKKKEKYLKKNKLLKVYYRSFKICNNLNSFHNDIGSIKSNLIKNACPPFLINKVNKTIHICRFFKLPYIGKLSHHIKNKLSKLCKDFFKENFNINLVFTSFNIKNYFSYNDLIPDDLKSSLLYKFTRASCSSVYIGETCHHFKTRS